LRDKLEQLLAKAKEANEKLTKRNRILIIACAAAILIIAVAGALLLNANNNATLFSNITQTEATEILTKLEDMGVTNASYSNGSITVPASQVDSLKAQLVLMGYPKQGLTYDVFTSNVDMMSTDFDKETYKLYDLQDRIAGTIRHFRGVYDAVVTISAGSEARYVMSRDRREPSAWVTVFMSDGGSPSAEQVIGIQRLVAASMPGMSSENVVVVDGSGNDVSNPIINSAEAQSGAARLKIALEAEHERLLKNKVEDLLYSIYGGDRVRVAVNCVVDIKKKLREIIEYSPINEDSIHGVLYHQEGYVEMAGQGEMVGGVPGTELNAQIPIYPTITTDGEEIYFTDERTFDYFVSRMTEQVTDEGGDVLDTKVAVVIDEERLTRTERDDLGRLVALAAGIDVEYAESQVAIVNAAFAREAVTQQVLIVDFLMDNIWLLIAAAGLILLILVLVILLMRRAAKIKRKRKEAEEALLLAQMAAAAPEEDKLDDEDILNTPLDAAKKTREQELKMQIGEFADLNPEIAAQLIKTWLKGVSTDNQ